MLCELAREEKGHWNRNAGNCGFLDVLPIFALPNFETLRHEKDFSTLRSQAPQQAWLPRAHVLSRWPRRTLSAPSQGPQEVVGFR
jgi:hypothetical protein